jgi:hypothetical protein
MILILNGHEVGTVAYLSGGQPVSITTEDSIYPKAADIRRTTALEVEPFVLEAGLLRPVMGWFDSLLSRQHASRTLELRQGRDGQGLSRKAFECVLIEIGFPPLDRRSAADAYLKLKVQPMRTETRRTNVPRLNSPPMVPLSGHSFRFTIDGALDGNEAQRVEGFTIKVGAKRHHVNDSGFSAIEPSSLTMPMFTIHLPPTQAKRLQAWFDADAEADRNRATTGRKGRLELFLRGGARAMALELADLGIVSLAGMNGASATVGIGCGKVSLGR